MKKASYLLLIMTLVFASCGEVQPPTTDVPPTTIEMLTSAEWPSFAPVEYYSLLGGDYIDEQGTQSIYRKIYHPVPLYVQELVTDWDKRLEAEDLIVRRRYSADGKYVETNEMDTVAFIKLCGITKEEFAAGLERYRQHTLELVASGFWPEINFNSEGWELPNADIIYTFDNEIINAYYRRENPVVPDWSKTTVYESYAEYLAANP